MKRFFEVFETLNLEEKQEELLSDVLVTRVSMPRDRSSVRIYLTAAHLIEKALIFRLEEEIRRQLFPNKKLTVKIIEQFKLSAQYTAKSLFAMYRESILLEFKRYDIVLYNMLSSAKLTWDGAEQLYIVLPKSQIYQKAEAEFHRVMDKLFEERCGVPISLRFAYEERKPAAEEVRYSKDYVPMAANQRTAKTQADDDFMDGSGADFSQKAGTGRRAAKTGKASQDMYADGGQNARAQKDTSFGGRQERGYGKNKEEQAQKKRPFKRGDNPELLYGRDFSDANTAIVDIADGMGEVAIAGEIIVVEERKLKSGKNLLSFQLTDYTDTIGAKLFLEDDEALALAKGFISTGSAVCIKGAVLFDNFDHEISIGHISGIKKHALNRKVREDHAQKKRVELHLHTKMSDMDGISDVADYIKTAKSFGMQAMAITDHGCVQAFPDAAHYLKGDDPFKLIYGVEGYLVDDLQTIVEHEQGQVLDTAYVVFDIETTGFNAALNQIIEIGAVKLLGDKIVDRFSSFVNPQTPIPFDIEKLTGINDAMVLDAETIETVLPRFLDWCGDAVIVAHNAGFDTGFIRANARRQGLSYDPTIIDTVGLARLLLPQLNRYKLDTVAKELKISLENHHRAVDDAECTAQIFLCFEELLKKRGVTKLSEIDRLEQDRALNIMKLPTYHIIILAKNDLGRINLYRLISDSHLKYFRKRPRIPKSLLTAYREGLIIGSACEAGELFQALLRGADDVALTDIASYYDYLEIQPLENNAFLIDDEKSTVRNREDLIALNKKILWLGDKLGKPVCATCDAHYVNPEDDIYRAIIMAGRGFEEQESHAKLYFRTTEEMLDEFSYLEPNRAKEVVIENPNRIADMCEYIKPVRPDKCPPVIPNSDNDLRDICYETAHRIYGPNLPKIVEERLEKELNSIISNGYSVMYIIAQKLVDKSVEDGYLVGSRGSVGSSFAATMAHITEVNPLSPHYVCPHCHYVDFDSDEVKAFSGMAGCDMPDKACPVCGKPLAKNGFDIPFETFLGFKGDKEPDIDLNFSGEYQAKAHAYTEVIFGKGQTFKAGTIGTLADKTAFGYVKKYFEEHGQSKRNAEINRIVQGCVGIRRTTGQHPGGIVVLPHGEDINSFTPIQHPANDMNSTIVTTHFDYHKIDHNLLKLDILGHDDPTMIRKLQDLTGLDPVHDIPLDSREVMSLFWGTEVLGIRPEDIQGTKLGCLGIPEFGTDFAMQMVIDAKPQYFSDLVRIAGLAHGTDVWLNNAKDLILDGTATIREAICCRDDIMIYLIQMGLEPSLSFTIMESVRKGKGLKAEWEEEMRAHDVPEWYIGSCKKIKYMFPKAHAAAYVMMAWRIAWCKIFRPKEYYTAYFSVRADGFSYELMCQGLEKLRYFIANLKKQENISVKEQANLRDMRITEEMYARGISFAKLDIYRAKAKDFQIIDGKIMPSFNSIDGLGEKAAEQIELAAKDGPFLSKEDFRNRTKVSKTVCDLMDDFGLLGEIPETNQISIFDL